MEDDLKNKTKWKTTSKKKKIQLLSNLGANLSWGWLSSLRSVSYCWWNTLDVSYWSAICNLSRPPFSHIDHIIFLSKWHLSDNGFHQCMNAIKRTQNKINQICRFYAKWNVHKLFSSAENTFIIMNLFFCKVTIIIIFIGFDQRGF